MKQVLITGVTGFAGQYLAELLLNCSDIELHGTYHSPDSRSRLGELERKIILHQLDLTDPKQVSTLIGEIKPKPNQCHYKSVRRPFSANFAVKYVANICLAATNL